MKKTSTQDVFDAFVAGTVWPHSHV